MKSFIAAVVLSLALGAPALADQHKALPTPMNPIGATFVGVTSLVASAIYAPLKIVFSVFSMTVLGPVNLGIKAIDVNLPKPVIRCLTGGDYVVTTEHLMGRDQLHFVGCTSWQ